MERSKYEGMRRRLRDCSREIVWALLLTLVALGAVAASLAGS